MAASDDRTIGQLVSDAVDDVRSIIQHEKALAKAEISRAAKSGGAGAGLLVAAVSMLGLSVIYLLISAAEAMAAAGLSRWAAFLIVGGALVVVAVLLALVGVALLKRVSGPDRAVAQGKGTVDDVKGAFSSEDPDAAPPAVAVVPAAGSRGAGRT